MQRRAFLRGAAVGVSGIASGALLNGCFNTSGAAQSTSAPTTPTGNKPTGKANPNKILLAYFSRPSENYFYGKRTQLKVGNTEVLMNMIRQHLECDVYRIVPANPYSDNYATTVARNVREQEANARPAIVKPLASIQAYDTVLLGSPIWNSRAPMIMSAFAESFDFSGKVVIPFTTHAMSGLGATMRDYAALCSGATIGEGLPVRGEEVQKAGAEVEAWLRRLKLLQK